MQSFLPFLFILICLSCSNLKPEKTEEESEIVTAETSDSLFILEYDKTEDFVKISPPEKLNFSLPDSSFRPRLYEIEDFNGDGKEDIIINLGACGTGGCIYGLFLREYENYFRLSLSEYLKGPQFEKEKNGSWSIYSYEEVQAYDPSRLYVNIFKIEPGGYSYELDASYIYYDTLAE